MPQKFTKMRLRNWVHSRFTGPPSQESKNTFSKNHGEFCEEKVLQHFLKKNYQVISKNKKIAGVEIDLLLFSTHYLMVEVKSLSSVDQLAFRLKTSQLNRLLRAQSFFQSYKQEAVQLVVAYVTSEEEIIIIDIADHLF